MYAYELELHLAVLSVSDPGAIINLKNFAVVIFFSFFVCLFLFSFWLELMLVYLFYYRLMNPVKGADN